MKKRENEETLFKRQLRDEWKAYGLWSEAYEPGRGSGFGYPDLQLLVDRALVPAELKIGRLLGKFLFSDEVRPAQVKWQWELERAGGRSCLLLGVRDEGNFALYAYHGRLAQWRAGWRIGTDVQYLGMLGTPQTMADLADYLRRLLSAG